MTTPPAPKRVSFRSQNNYRRLLQNPLELECGTGQLLVCGSYFNRAVVFNKLFYPPPKISVSGSFEEVWATIPPTPDFLNDSQEDGEKFCPRFCPLFPRFVSALFRSIVTGNLKGDGRQCGEQTPRFFPLSATFHGVGVTHGVYVDD